MRKELLDDYAMEQIRKALGLTLDGMSGALGVHKSTLFRWESGESQPQARHMAKLAEFVKSKKPIFARI